MGYSWQDLVYFISLKMAVQKDEYSAYLLVSHRMSLQFVHHNCYWTCFPRSHSWYVLLDLIIENNSSTHWCTRQVAFTRLYSIQITLTYFVTLLLYSPYLLVGCVQISEYAAGVEGIQLVENMPESCLKKCMMKVHDVWNWVIVMRVWILALPAGSIWGLFRHTHVYGKASR